MFHRLYCHYYAFISTDLNDLSNYQVIQINFLKLSLLERNGSIIFFHTLLASTVFFLVFKAMNEESSVGAMKCKFTCICGQLYTDYFCKAEANINKRTIGFIKTLQN